MKCGLLGRKLGHSYSPVIHGYLGTYSYELFEKEPEELAAFLYHGDFSGINVTIPYKKAVIPYLDSMTEVARKLGAVNTIIRQEDGSLLGHNSDYFGFQSLMEQTKVNVSGKKMLVLGSGGASATAVQVLKDLNAQVIVISRNGENNYQNLHRHADAAVIVNATPVGMYPHNGQSPVELDLFPDLEAVIDVIYNPARTQLLLDAQEKNIPAFNGLWMLVAQAKEAAEYFTGSPVGNQKIDTIYNALHSAMENIILIGMPGSGKSTIAKQLAAELGRHWVDSDMEIEKEAQKSIPVIFEEDGEAVFRKWETQVLSRLGKESGLIIATGGGCVTRQYNYPLLHQNGSIFWIQRDLKALPKDGRPLSMKNDLDHMYAERKQKYAFFADYRIDNNGSIQDAANQILQIMGISI